MAKYIALCKAKLGKQMKFVKVSNIIAKLLMKNNPSIGHAEYK